MIPIDQIIPWEKNPRHNDHAVEKVAESIKRFGFASPIILNHDYTVIAGHTRLKASKLLKLKEIPCRILNLSAEEAELLALVDNKTAELSTWNEELLQNILSNLEDEFLIDIGFDQHIEELDYGILEEFENDDQIEKMQEATRKGIMIEFELGDYEEALELTSYFRKKGYTLGSLLITHLRDLKDEIE